MILEEYDIYFFEFSLWNGWSEDTIIKEEKNQKRYKYYYAISTMNGGKEEKKFLEKSNDTGLYYNFCEVKVGDIILVSEWDSRKKRQTKYYQIVTAKDDNHVVIIGYYGNTSLRRTYKLKTLLDCLDVEQLYLQYINGD